MIGVHRAVAHGRLRQPVSVAYHCGELRGGEPGRLSGTLSFTVWLDKLRAGKSIVEWDSGDLGRGRGIRMTMISDDVDFRWSHRMRSIRPISLAHTSLSATLHALGAVLESYYIVHPYTLALYITRTALLPPSSRNPTLLFIPFNPPVPTHSCIVPFIPVHS